MKRLSTLLRDSDSELDCLNEGRYQTHAMFVRCYADNYRCFGGFTLPLGPLSVLLGANGSGKSTVVGLFAKLRDFVMGREKSLDLFPPESLTRWDRRIEQTFE